MHIFQVFNEHGPITLIAVARAILHYTIVHGIIYIASLTAILRISSVKDKFHVPIFGINFGL